MLCSARKVHTLHGEVWKIDAEWVTQLGSAGIDQQTDWSDYVGEELVSASRRVTRCYRVGLPDDESVYFKRYVYLPRFWHEFWLRPSKPAVECWAYSRLRSIGIPTLEVLAFGERRRFGLLLAGCIVTRGLPDRIDLADFTKSVWCHWPCSRRREVAHGIAGQLLRQLRIAHQNGFFHHDLKWRNILIHPSGDPRSLTWIDAPRASQMMLRRRRGIVQDLSSLARIAIFLFSRSELIRFLGMYLGDSSTPAERKRLFREVQRHLSRRMPEPFVVHFSD